MNTKHDKDYDAPKGISRRSFLARGVAVGAVASAAGLGLLSPACRGTNERASPSWRIGFRAA